MGQIHQSDPRVLGRRTLEHDHRALAARLRPGMTVLDVGCGTGAITAGIARAVGPEGMVVGVDRDGSLLEIARREHGGVAGVRFEVGDAMRLGYEGEFDIVTAARVVQWVSEPGVAIAGMARAAKPSGQVVILDYNHAENEWEPEPPEAFRRFYRAFLEWRSANGWDNHMAEHLPELLRGCGLVEVASEVQDEVAARGDVQANLWLEVMESMGAAVVSAGFLDVEMLHQAVESYGEWTGTSLVRQVLRLRAVSGVRPQAG